MTGTHHRSAPGEPAPPARPAAPAESTAHPAPATPAGHPEHAEPAPRKPVRPAPGAARTAPPVRPMPPTPPARIAPLPPEQWPPELHDLLAASHKDGPGRVNLFGTLAHHPALAHAWLALARVLTHEGTLPHRQRELVILRTAHSRGGSFVYERHRAVASDAGLTPPETSATAAPPASHPWAADDLALLEACDALAAGAPVPPALWDRLAAALRPDQLIEFLILAGQCATMCATLGVLHTPPDGDRTPSG
ncbi:carboxymuconolactone decarboxylase family protein [Streptomyces sp. NPDC058622]|uniref:carboxymuconolactone decarboxylase family protein n=1 Tax=Streptomyces sp. NPDC058622 TaxID=3346562 RepID=UPI00364F1EAB